MDENFGGHPSPLNPQPNAGQNTNTMQSQTMAPSSVGGPNPMPNLGTTQNPTQANEIAQQNISSTNPIRPMEQAPTPAPEPPKKKKTGLIIGIIVAAVILIGVVVVVLLLLNSSDPVAKAVEKIATGQAPENVALDGTIEIDSNSDDIGSLSTTINLKSQGSTSSLINTTSAEIQFTFKDLETITINAEEVYPSNGDLYLKVDSISTALSTYGEMITEYQNTVYAIGDTITSEATDEATTTTNESTVDETETSVSDNSMFAGITSTLEIFNGMLGKLDGQWIKIPLDDLEDLATSSTGENTDCSAKLVSDIKNSGNILAQLYNENAFISSTTEDVTLASKNSEVYQVVLDNEKLNNFIAGVNNANFAKNYKSCTDSNDDIVSAADLSGLPTFYVELDNEYNFTRIYTSTEVGEGDEATLTADLGLSYPENINVSQPENTVNLVEVIQKLFSGLDITEEDLTPKTE